MEHALVEHDEARRTLLKVEEDSTEVHIVTETGELLLKFIFSEKTTKI